MNDLEKQAIANQVGFLICELRKKKRMTQSQFAVVLNANQRDISWWESGKVLPPSRALYAMCLRFNLELSYFDVREKACV